MVEKVVEIGRVKEEEVEIGRLGLYKSPIQLGRG